MTEVSSPRFRFVEANGLRLHLAEAGDPGAPPVVLLHGFPEFWRSWRRQLGPLAEAGYHVLAPDQRGYNLSSKPRRVAAYCLDLLAADVVGLLDAEGIERAPLVGHDWGGLVAWWVAATQPYRVSELVILNAPHPLVMRRFLRRDRAQRRKSWYVFFFQLPWLPERWFRARNFDIGVRSLAGSSRRGTFGREDLEAYKRAWAEPGALKSMIDWYRAAIRHPPRTAAAPVAAPTLLLWGERDRFLDPRLAAASRERCVEARLETFPDATHWIQHELPEAVNAAILEHLR